MIGGRKKERTGGDGGKSEGGSQALAQPVMIDWLAGSQQTDVRPPDQPIHPRANPPLLPDPTVHHVSSCFLSLALALFLSLFHLEQPLPSHRHQNHRPWSTGLLKKLVQCTKLSLSFSLSLLFLSFPPPSIPHSSFPRLSFLPWSTEHSPGYPPLSQLFQPFFHRSGGSQPPPPRIPCVTYVQKVGIAR